MNLNTKTKKKKPSLKQNQSNIPSNFKHPSFYQHKKFYSRSYQAITLSVLAIVLLAVLGFILYLIVLSWPGISKVNFFGLTFDASKNVYGILGFIIGTITTTLIALIIAIPVSVAASLLVVKYFPRFIIVTYKYLIEIFAGLPSIIFGLIGVVFLSSFIPLSYTLAGLVLATMIMPLISIYIIIELQSHPKEYALNSIALGATRMETHIKLELKLARKGVVIGSLVGLSRAIGETMAIVMVIGGSAAFPEFSHFINGFLARSGSSITVQIVSNFLEAQGTLVNVLFWLGLILFLAVSVVNGMVFWILGKKARKHNT